MIAEMVSHKAVLDEIVMISCLMYAVGGVWSAALGYLLLDAIGWRIFILLTSLPIFIPPIFMLHFCFAGPARPKIQEEKIPITEKETTAVIVPNLVARTVKLGLYCAVNTFQGWLTILLVPSMIQMLNIKEAESQSDCSVTATQGSELLLLGLVTFAAILGRLFIHYTRKKIPFRTMQVGVALLNVLSFAAMLVDDNLVLVVATNFTVKLLFGITAMSSSYILYDVEYFGAARFALGSSVAHAVGLAGGVIGTVMVPFAPLLAVKITALVLSALQIPVVLSMTEIQ